MSTLSVAQVYALSRSAGLDPARAVIATAIAMAESGLRTDAMGDVGIQTSTWGPSVGLWQIRSLKAESGKGTPRDATRLTDPAFNATAMMSISGQGANWKPWSTYTSGAYLKNIPKVTPAAADVNSDPSWQDKLAAIPAAVGAQIQSGAAAVGSAVTGGAASLNPTGGWAQQALSIGLKIAGVGAGIGLVLLGAYRLVASASSAS